MEQAASLIQSFIESNADVYDRISHSIWENPEIAFHEEKSAALYRQRLADSGFVITDFPEMPHSFMGEHGSSGPIIAFMGEYDALPGMSQRCSTTQEPVSAGAPGHACGHNLLGMGALAAAEALAYAAREFGIALRVRLYGCPAEESLGRIPLVKAGRFNDVDAVMTWHPADVNTPHRYTTSANLALKFNFSGKASHAAMAPQTGRSALDAVQLFNMSLEFMREHVQPGVMLHYVISNGGDRPNIVPAQAASFLYIRAPNAAIIRSVAKRILKAAKGACLMTETSYRIEIQHGKCDYIPNDTIQNVLAQAMLEIPLPEPTKDERAFMKALQASVSKADRYATLDPIAAPRGLAARIWHDSCGDFGRGKRIGGSLDTGDVSYVAPTGQMNAATWPIGIGAHTWQSCSASGSSWAFKASRWAGACMALSGLKLAKNPDLIKNARQEHHRSAPPYRSTMDF